MSVKTKHKEKSRAGEELRSREWKPRVERNSLAAGRKAVASNARRPSAAEASSGALAVTDCLCAATQRSKSTRESMYTRSNIFHLSKSYGCVRQQAEYSHEYGARNCQHKDREGVKKSTAVILSEAKDLRSSS
jgi:hypothetical protein